MHCPIPPRAKVRRRRSVGSGSGEPCNLQRTVPHLPHGRHHDRTSRARLPCEARAPGPVCRGLNSPELLAVRRLPTIRLSLRLPPLLLNVCDTAGPDAFLLVRCIESSSPGPLHTRVPPSSLAFHVAVCSWSSSIARATSFSSLKPSPRFPQDTPTHCTACPPWPTTS